MLRPSRRSCAIWLEPLSPEPRDRAPPQARWPRLCLQPLLPRRQPAALAGSHHALGVRVPPPPRIALGKDQHVLAERGQVTAAKRAAVGRGLAVLRATD